jgi:hypothetical protein
MEVAAAPPLILPEGWADLKFEVARIHNKKMIEFTSMSSNAFGRRRESIVTPARCWYSALPTNWHSNLQS